MQDAIIGFDSLCNRVQVSVPVDQLSGREKCNLLLFLLTHMGIADALKDDPKAEAAIMAAYDRFWNA